jgi:DNA-binding SARP family transcriptional activator
VLTVSLLGRPTVRWGERDAPSPRDRKTWALLAYLLIGDGSSSRQRLADLLFPEANDPLAGVRWSLAQLRRLLGDGVELRDDPVRLQLPDPSTVDLDVLAHGSWREAVALPLECELLEGLTFDSAPAFELWLSGARRRLRMTAAAVLHEAALATLAQDPEQAVLLAERTIDIDPYDENHHVLLIRALAAAGRGAGAAEHAAECTRFLRQELGVEPTAAVRDALAVAAAPSPWTSTSASVLAQLEAGEAAVGAGSWSAGMDHLRQAVAQARRLADEQLLGRCLVALGGALVHAARGHDEEGAASLHEGGGIAERVGDDQRAALAWRELAWVEFLRARHDRAHLWLARATAAAGGDAVETAWIAMTAGASHTDVGDYRQAERDLETAVELASTAGLAGPSAFALSFLGRLRLLRGELDEAGEALRASVDAARMTGSTSFIPWPEALLAEVQLRCGDLGAATRMWEHAFTMGRQLGDPCWESMGARGLGLVAIRSGDLDRGIALLEQAPVMCRRLPDSYLWIEAYGLEALCDVAVGHDLPSAGRWIAELERLATRGGFKELTALALYHRARRHESGAAEAATATADSIDNSALRRRIADLDLHVTGQTTGAHVLEH